MQQVVNALLWVAHLETMCAVAPREHWSMVEQKCSQQETPALDQRATSNRLEEGLTAYMVSLCSVPGCADHLSTWPSCLSAHHSLRAMITDSMIDSGSA